METISSFFLPKIDLSFDTSVPCASYDFVSAINKILPDNLIQPDDFDKLLAILNDFGHFVPTQLLIGGRLYSVDKKDITKTTNIENELKEHKANLQIAIETPRVDVGLEAQLNLSDSQKNALAKSKEAQKTRLTAIGGEGAFVSDPSKWIVSLKNFKAWSVVKFDGMIPSINILPSILKERCINVLKEAVNTHTIERLLDKKAHFLFYNGYYENIGRLAQPEFHFIQSMHNGAVININSNLLTINAPVEATKSVKLTNLQNWYFLPDGKIISKEGYNKKTRYVLSVNGTQLIMSPEDFNENQHWELIGGYIKNSTTNQYLILVENQNSIGLTLDMNQPTNRKGVWQFEPDFTRLMANTDSHNQTSSSVAAITAIKENSSFMSPGEELNISTKLISANKVHTLAITKVPATNKPKLTLSKNTEETWYFPGTYSDDSLKLVFDHSGYLKLIGVNKTVIYEFNDNLSPAHKLELLNNGNLELLDSEDNVIWESNTAELILIKNKFNGQVLSTHHRDYAPDPDANTILLTCQPYVGASNQLWIINRKGQLISALKTLRGNQKAITSDQNGRLNLEKLSGNSNQKWLVSGSLITNLDNNKLMTARRTGEELNCQNRGIVIEDSQKWDIIATNIRSNKNTSKNIMYKFNDAWGESKGQDYEALEANDHYIHNSVQSLEGNRLKGVKLVKYKNRIAMIALKNVGEEFKFDDSRDFKNDNYYTKKQNELYIDKTPVFIPIDASPINIGLKAKGNRITLGMQVKLKNNTLEQLDNAEWTDDNYVNAKGLYLDLHPITANKNENIVGFGLTTHGNRIKPYLLVIDNGQ
jgi:hypothetical protein